MLEGRAGVESGWAETVRMLTNRYLVAGTERKYARLLKKPVGCRPSGFPHMGMCPKTSSQKHILSKSIKVKKTFKGFFFRSFLEVFSRIYHTW